MQKRPRRHSRLKNLVVPHEENGYHPHLFRATALGVLALAIVLVEGAYVLDTKVAQDHQGFLASVLPGALLSLTNSDRAANGVATLTQDPQLAAAAQLKANDMAAKGYFAHVSPDGKTPWYWLGQVGYHYTYAGENLAINFDDSSAVETAWMNSPTHRANIVKPQYTRVGYAVAKGMYQGKETTFVVQELATRPSDETVTVAPTPKNPVTKAVDKVIAVATPASKPEPAVQVAGPAAETPSVKGTEAVVPSTSAQAGEPMILAAKAAPQIHNESGLGGFLKDVAASPLRTVIYLLSALIVVMAMLLAFALTAHKKVRTLEVLGGGILVIGFALSVLLYNASHAPAPVLPNQAAAIAAPAS